MTNSDKLNPASSILVYKDTRKLLDVLVEITVHFPSTYKAVEGAQLRLYLYDIMNKITVAYNNRDAQIKYNNLIEASSKLQTVSVIVRKAGESHWFSLNKFAQLSEVILKINKQLTSWQNSVYVKTQQAI